MPRIFLFVVALTFSISAAKLYAQEDLSEGCPGPDTSSRFESCILSKKIAISEKNMQQLYQDRIRSAHSQNVAVTLRAAQNAWEHYRDKTCQYEEAEYGGINSISWVRCNERLTSERARYFEELR
jgi:uncharacterized protein YecT (DUF1311 family)